jgi:hypothetical protein
MYLSSTARSPAGAGTCGSCATNFVSRFLLLVSRKTRNEKLETVSVYQDDFETPGISPLSASPRKHKRQMPNLRRKPRGRPQIAQRLCWRVENFGFRASLTRFAVVAIFSS